MHRCLLAAVFAVASACSSASSPPPVCATEGAACGDQGTCTAGACLRTVRGRSGTVLWTATGEQVPVMDDLSTWTVAALLQAPSGERLVTGTGAADGTFTIPGVPDGPYWLELWWPGRRPYYLGLSETTVDLVVSYPGRLGAGTQATGGATWTFSGLEPWAVGDRIEVTCAGTGSWEYWVDHAWSAPAAGDTSFTASTPRERLYDGARGDRLFAAQLAVDPAAPRPTLRVTRAAQLPDTTAIVDGVPATLDVALQPVTETATLQGIWRRPAFAALAPGMGPAPYMPSVPSQVLSVAAPFPYGLAGPSMPGAVPVLLELHTPTAGDLGEDLPLAVPYGRYLPPEWAEVVTATLTVGGDLVNPQAVTVLPVGAAPVDVAPSVGPVTELRVAGKDALAGGLGSVGATPTLSWAPPAVGAAEGYYLVLWSFSPSVPGSYLQRVASFTTRLTSVTLPAGLLADPDPGRVFLAVVQAWRRDGSYAEAATAPFRP